MPPAVALAGAVIGGTVAASAGVIAAVGTIGAAIVGGVVSMGINAVGNKLIGTKSSSKAPSSAVDSGVMVTVQDNVASLPIVYGRRKVAGRQVYVSTSGASNKFLHLVFAIAEGQIQEIERITFGDNEIVFDGSITPMTATSGSLAASQARGKYTNFVSVEWRLGTTTQTAFTDLVTSTAGQEGAWTADHKGLGVAMVHIKIAYDKEKMNQVPQVLFDIKGKQVSTSFGGGAVWSDNPAACLLDYLTNTTYGKGLALADIDQTSFNEVRDYCDQVVTLYTDGSAVTGKRYLANGFLDPDTPVFDNIKSLLSCFNGYLLWSAGKYKFKVLKDETNTGFTFDESNIIGQISMQLNSKENLSNRVKMSFYNSGLDFAEDFAIWEDEDLRNEEDNGEVLELEVALPFTSDYTRALNLAKQTMEQSRLGNVVSFTATPNALEVEVGDRVWFSHPYLGFQDDYRVMGMVLNPDKTISVTLMQYDDVIYSLTAISTAPGPSAQDRNNQFNGGNFGAISPAPTSVQFYLFCPGNVVGYEQGYKITCTAPSFPTIGYYEYVVTTSTTVRTFTSNTNYVVAPLTAWPGGTLTHIKVRVVSTDGTIGTLSTGATTPITNPDSATLCNLTPPQNVTHWQICDGADGASVAERMGTGNDVSGDQAKLSGPGVHKMKVKWQHGTSVADFVSYKMRLSYYIPPAGYDTSLLTADPPAGSTIIKDVTETVAKTGGAISTDYQEYTFSALVTAPVAPFTVTITEDPDDGVSWTAPAELIWRSVQVAGVKSDSTEVWQYDETISLNPVSGTECYFNPPAGVEFYQVCNGTGGANATDTFTTNNGGNFWTQSGGKAYVGFKIQHGYDHAITDKYVVGFVLWYNGVEIANFEEEVTRDPSSSYLGYQYYISSTLVNFDDYSGSASFGGYVRSKITSGNILSTPTLNATFIANADGSTDCPL
jgi:hypothetical protein